MSADIKTYNSVEFRKEYFNASPELNRLFEKSMEDFFCLRIEELIERVHKPIRPCREESHTLIFVTEGSYKTKIGFQEYVVRPDQIVVLQAGAVFSTDDLSKRVKGFTCHFHPNTLIGKFGQRSLTSAFDFLNVGNEPIIALNDQSKPNVTHLFQRLCEEFKNEDGPNSDLIHAYLHALLTELNTVYGQRIPAKHGASYSICVRFRSLVNERVKDNLKVSDFADLMNISPNHLNKAVKSITAKSASKMIDEAKLIEIKYLLYQSNLSISEISFQMGYLDASYFTRFFKKYEGTSPSTFRKMIEKS